MASNTYTAVGNRKDARDAAAANRIIPDIIAAKGVIRFPEISRDERGDKAEEFLIGSLASWALAVLAAVLLTR